MASTTDKSANPANEVLATRREGPGVTMGPGGGDVDLQVRTAKAFPRSIGEFKQRALEMVTLDQETAESCLYTLKRGRKIIEGPSARCAEIIASSWGNLRVAAKTTGDDDTFTYAEAVCWDLETNTAVSYETKRRITNKEGLRFGDDMIGVTSNAAVSIAFRNSVFRVVPRAYVNEIYKAARQAAAGDARTLKQRRTEMIAYFGAQGISEQQVLDLLDVRGVDGITLDHLCTLRGVATAVKEGTATLEHIFSGNHGTEQPGAGQTPQAEKTELSDGPPVEGPDEGPVKDPEPETPTEPPQGNTTGGTGLKANIIRQIKDELYVALPGDSPAAEGARLKKLNALFGKVRWQDIETLPNAILASGLDQLKQAAEQNDETDDCPI